VREDLIRLARVGDDFERTLLGAGKGDRMSDEARGALLAALAAGAVTARSAVPRAPSAPPKDWGANPARWIALGGMATIVLGSVAATWSLAPRRKEREVPSLPAPQTQVASAVASPPLGPEALGPEAASTGSPPQPSPPRPARSAPSPRSSGGDSALGAELQLIERARAAVSGGRAREALDALAKHRARFANGALVQEEQVLQIEAYRLAGDNKQASSLARDYLARHPEGPYSPRVRRLLEFMSPDMSR
jgi:hypothetical protein